MTRAELRKALESISDMSDADIALNCEFIRHACAGAAGLLGQDHATICRQRGRLKNLRTRVLL